jgi:hypothetical protein
VSAPSPEVLDPAIYERLRPDEKHLCDQKPQAAHLFPHPLRERRVGAPETRELAPGYMVRFRCRFCIALDGVSATSSDMGRIGFSSAQQHAEHLQHAHYQQEA